MRYCILFLVLVFSLASCDIIEAPYREIGPAVARDSLCLQEAVDADPFSGMAAQRNVLLEEFTGHLCGNCPTATEQAKKITSESNGRVILMVIHAGGLANHMPDQEKYSTDFTTPVGNQIFTELIGFDAVPLGMINRRNTGTGYFYDFTAWQSTIDDELAQPAEALIDVHTCYNEEDRSVDIVVQTRHLADATDREYLAVYLVEHEVVDWQKDYRLSGNQDIPDYVHRDVFRDAIGGAWGVPLSSEAVRSGDEFTETFSYTLPPDWDDQQMRVIALVHEFGTKRIRQVAYEPVR